LFCNAASVATTKSAATATHQELTTPQRAAGGQVAVLLLGPKAALLSVLRSHDI